MSKTDKTRPWQVRAAERPMHTCVPVHRHENGECDLPEDPAGNVVWFETGHCYWTYGNAFFYGPDHGCGCPMCTQQDERKRARRQERAAGRREAREALGEYRRGVGDDA